MKYEYVTKSPRMKKGLTKRDIDIESTEIMLNELGHEGWELISVVPISGNTGVSWGGTTASLLYYFRRQINK